MNTEFLYRGVNLDLHQQTGGELRPKCIGRPFKRFVYYGEKVYYGGGAVYGESPANAVIMHQQHSSENPTSGVSTTPNFEHAIRYATHNGKHSGGVVYKIATSLLAQHGVSMYPVAAYAKRPAIPEDNEIILVAKDFGPLPPEIGAIVKSGVCR